MIQKCDHCSKSAVVKKDLKNITLLWCVACYRDSSNAFSIRQPTFKNK